MDKNVIKFEKMKASGAIIGGTLMAISQCFFKIFY
jgi:hypothetical protein